MKKTLRRVALGLSLILVSGALAAQVIGKAEDQIRWRQSAYNTMAWSMGRIKANLEGSFSKEQVVQAANTIQAIANSGMGALYQPGTDKGSGHHETSVKSEFFKEQDKVKELAMAYNREANEMAKVAATGDAAAAKIQFGKLGESCKACHDKFRKEEKK
ncbi:c-type cytochrome [Denitratisoma oestradiolicum]|uniref:Cytochrome c n=1 Tax=Denitratisoma oestradiolicum TaxID=311182 RepID=A0A6S6XYN9_9PROT|nr:cytochrome c [Denitratisoma oestradiolicum]TWO80120.1 cytochrome C [Denitratisoma oestradiolicum]CAB1370043.1 Cytochrome c' [Denitratisoma oestradiolicum]